MINIPDDGPDFDGPEGIYGLFTSIKRLSKRDVELIRKRFGERVNNMDCIPLYLPLTPVQPLFDPDEDLYDTDPT